MDGWVVAGSGPWRLDGSVRMGEAPGNPLMVGTARAITTGGAVPEGATAVLRSERSRVVEDVVVTAGVDMLLPALADVRRAGEEIQVGDIVVGAGVRVTPAVVAAAAATGTDAVQVIRRPRVALVLLGDEVVQEGIPAPGQVRDAFGVSIPEILRGAGMDVTSVTYVPDDAAAVRDALRQEDVDLVISTGGTGHGHGDHLVSVLDVLGAAVPVRGVAMRPGHPTVLARRADGVLVLGLPGNPLAALAAIVALGLPLIAGLLGSSAPPLLTRVAARPLTGPPSGVRLIAVAETSDGIVPVQRQGPAMTCGLVGADGIAVVDADGVGSGTSADVLSVPWAR